MLIQYKRTYKRYPAEDGKAFLTYPYFLDDSLDPRLLVCPGKGAVNDKIPDPAKLRPVVWNAEMKVKDQYGKRPRWADWPKNVIGYTGPFADDAHPSVQPVHKRWRLSHLHSPDRDEKVYAKENRLTLGRDSTLPLVADDDDDPKNHVDGYMVGFADGHIEFITDAWDVERWPFAALVRHAP